MVIHSGEREGGRSAKLLNLMRMGCLLSIPGFLLIGFDWASATHYTMEMDEWAN
jgi:hypothetical protein